VSFKIQLRMIEWLPRENMQKYHVKLRQRHNTGSEKRTDGESLHNPGCVCLFRNYERVKCIKKMYWIARVASVNRFPMGKRNSQHWQSPGVPGWGITKVLLWCPIRICACVCARARECVCVRACVRKNLVSQREPNWGRGRLIKIKLKLILLLGRVLPPVVNTRFSYYRAVSKRVVSRNEKL